MSFIGLRCLVAQSAKGSGVALSFRCKYPFGVTNVVEELYGLTCKIRNHSIHGGGSVCSLS